MNVTQAAKYLNVTRYAIYLAINNKRLVAVKSNPIGWSITESDLEEYKRTRFNPDYKQDKDGKLVFVDGWLSPRQLEEKYGVSRQRIYHLIRDGRLAHKRVGCSYVVHKDDLIRAEAERAKDSCLMKGRE